MAKEVIGEKLLLSWIRHSCKLDYGIVVGLLIGQRGKECDYLVHMARTQLVGPHEFSDERLADISHYASPEGLVNVNSKHIVEHYDGVLQMLPGGFSVLGLFVFGKVNICEKDNDNKLKLLLTTIEDLNNIKGYIPGFVTSDPILLHAESSSKFVCKRLETASGSWKPIECSFTLDVFNWKQIVCYVDFEQFMPFYQDYSKAPLTIQEKLDDIWNQILGLLGKSTCFLNGVNFGDDVYLADTMNNGADDDDNSPVIADLIIPLDNYESLNTFTVKDCASEWKNYGTLCSIVYLHRKISVGEAIQALKKDIATSLRSRWIMHCNCLLEDDYPDTGKVVVYEAPCRAEVPLPCSKVRFVEHIFPGEEITSILPSTIEYLDIHEDLRYKMVEKRIGISDLRATNSKTAFKNAVINFTSSHIPSYALPLMIAITTILFMWIYSG